MGWYRLLGLRIRIRTTGIQAHQGCFLSLRASIVSDHGPSFVSKILLIGNPYGTGAFKHIFILGKKSLS
jgi:hypothetical protein